MTNLDVSPTTMDEGFEDALVEHLEPIRQYVLAVSVYHLFNSGLFDALLQGATSIQALSELLRLDPDRLDGLMDYLANEELITKTGDTVSLSPVGHSFTRFRPWYTMLIGGYAETFHQVGEKLTAGSDFASRNATQVGIGSCGISHYDSIPLTRELMQHIPRGCKRLLDLGCGSGLYLQQFCEALPEIEAYGIEPDAEACQAARELIKRAGMADRVQVVNTTATDFLQSDLDYQPDFVVFGFVLHEILKQEGEEHVESLLRDLVKKSPGLYIIVIEVDQRITDREYMRHPLAKSYYNPYYLLHAFTNQRLETTTFWQQLFQRAGLEIVAERTTDPNVDSTALEVGFLLRQQP